MKIKCAKCKRNLHHKKFHPEIHRKRGFAGYCKLCSREAHKIWRKSLTPKERQTKSISTVLLKFGLSFDDYEVVLERQKGVCAICKRKEPNKLNQYNVKKRLAIDHNHITGKFRGLLCSICNKSLGGFHNVELLKQAINYLKKTEV